MSIELIHAAFDKGKADLETAASELRSTRLRIERRINDYVGQGWTGSAAASFLPAWEEWLTGALDAEEALIAMRQLMQAHQDDMRVEDETTQQRLDQISARIIERLG